VFARILAIVVIAASASAQAPPRRATNIAALLTFPVFYHGRSVLIVGTVATEKDGKVRVSDGSTSLRVVFKGSAPDGNDEIRGEFWDLGRMKSDDPRLVSIDLRQTFGVDPVVADMLLRQRRTLDPAKRREIIFDIQRYLAKQQYYVQLASAVNVAVWDRALRNYGPNLGFDWGGRLMAAWLDR